VVAKRRGSDEVEGCERQRQCNIGLMFKRSATVDDDGYTDVM
jgi:hypothetical protein